MSKYKEVAVSLDDLDALGFALNEWAKLTGKVFENHVQSPASLRAFYGGETDERAVFIVRGEQFGSHYSEDLGFIWDADAKTMRVMHSTHDDYLVKPIIDELEVQDARYKTTRLARLRGLRVMSEIRDGDRYRIKVAGMLPD